MYTILLRSHSGLRWILLAFILGAIIKSALSLSGNKSYDSLDNQLSLFSLIFAHIQLLLGFGLYFISPLVTSAMESGMGVAMKNAVLRFWLVEHLTGMLIGIVLITIGRIASKKATEDKTKFKKVLLYFSIGLFIILATIPWPFRETLGRSWF